MTGICFDDFAFRSEAICAQVAGDAANAVALAFPGWRLAFSRRWRENCHTYYLLTDGRAWALSWVPVLIYYDDEDDPEYEHALDVAKTGAEFCRVFRGMQGRAILDPPAIVRQLRDVCLLYFVERSLRRALLDAATTGGEIGGESGGESSGESGGESSGERLRPPPPPAPTEVRSHILRRLGYGTSGKRVAFAKDTDENAEPVEAPEEVIRKDHHEVPMLDLRVLYEHVKQLPSGAITGAQGIRLGQLVRRTGLVKPAQQSKGSNGRAVIWVDGRMKEVDHYAPSQYAPLVDVMNHLSV